MKFARETLTAEFIREGVPLAMDHFNEVVDDAKDVEFKPDLKKYFSGDYRLFTMRDSGRLCGYAVFGSGDMAYSKSKRAAFQNLLYVEPSARGFNSIKFMKWCDAELAADGFDYVVRDVPANSGTDKVLTRMGYNQTFVFYKKSLT